MLPIEFRIESTQEWVPYESRTPQDEDALRILVWWDQPKEIVYADIPGNSWNQSRLNLFVARANDLLTFRIPLSDPSLVDDPHGPNGTDPNDPPWFFWDGGDLCSRTMYITGVTYSASTGLHISRAQRQVGLNG